MALSWNKWVFLFLLSCTFAANTARAEASAHAIGNGNFAWATEPDQQKANEVALSGCNNLNPKKDCKLDTTRFIAEAKAGVRQGWARSSKSMADAQKIALDSCGYQDCKITTGITAPGFYVLVESKINEDAKNESSFLYLSYGDSDMNNVTKVAKRKCSDLTGKECEIAWSGAISGNQVTKSSAKPQASVSEKSCRPQTASIKCSSQCQNGSCIVNYENGCKIRVQVQPTFDAFNNQWKYPSPSC